MATGYSLIDEVWGGDAMPVPKTERSKKSSKRSKRKNRIAPVCDSHKPAADTEESFVPYDPAVFSEVHVDDPADPLYGSMRPVMNRPYPRYEDQEEIEAAEETPKDSPPAVQVQPEIRYVQLPHRRADGYDIFLYIFSGILLVFVMEQFLQIGINMGMHTDRV